MPEAIGQRGPMLSSGCNSPYKSESNKVTPLVDNIWLRNKKWPPTKVKNYFGTFETLGAKLKYSVNIKD